MPFKLLSIQHCFVLKLNCPHNKLFRKLKKIFYNKRHTTYVVLKQTNTFGFYDNCPLCKHPLLTPSSTGSECQNTANT